MEQRKCSGTCSRTDVKSGTCSDYPMGRMEQWYHPSCSGLVHVMFQNTTLFLVQNSSNMPQNCAWVCLQALHVLGQCPARYGSTSTVSKNFNSCPNGRIYATAHPVIFLLGLGGSHPACALLLPDSHEGGLQRVCMYDAWAVYLDTPSHTHVGLGC
jgi:hypothetical protein